MAVRRLSFIVPSSCQHAFDGSRSKRRRAQFPASSSPSVRQPVEQRSRGRREVQAVRAAIVRVGPALDQAVVGQPVEQPRKRDRLQVEHVGKFRLFETLIAIKAHQHRPLGAGDAELPGLLVGIGPQQARYVADCKGEFPFAGCGGIFCARFGIADIVSKLIICSTC